MEEEQGIISVPALRLNEHQVQMNRLLLSLIAGVVCGILRIEGVINGVGMYLLWQVIGSSIMVVAMRDAKKYFPHGNRDVFLGQIFSGIMTFILVWTLVYDVVHIF